MLVAIYARVSTSDQSCEMQLHELREYVARLPKVRRDAIEAVLRLRGGLDFSREQILACPPAERRRRQAAWKWIERNNALLAEVLSNRP